LSSIRAAANIQSFKDKNWETLLMGNFFANNVELGRQDADFGSVLISKGNGNFDYAALKGLAITGEVRKILPIKIGNRISYILARNNATLKVIAFK
jgi:hypothetical protein